MIHFTREGCLYQNGLNISARSRRVVLYVAVRRLRVQLYARIVPVWSDLRRHSRLARWCRLQIRAEWRRA